MVLPRCRTRLRSPRATSRLSEQIFKKPEFISRAFDQWTYRRRIVIRLIQPDMHQNDFIESFCGKLWDACSSAHWFRNLAHARASCCTAVR
jgi:hypothetical protein